MARFSFPFVQIGALVGAASMVAFGQWLGAGDAARTEPPGRATTRIDLGAVEVFPSAPRAVTAASGEPPATAGLAAAAALRPRLAVIIDDVGHDPALARVLTRLPVTLSILPYAPAAPEIAAEAAAAGREVFVHLPMEPVGLDDPGPGAITTALSPEAIDGRVRTALARVPGAAGLNNHMGSRATRDDAVMAALFAVLAGRDLVFVDSLTHPDSVAAKAAREAGLAAFDRDVFLDSLGADPGAQLDAALALAVETGRAIAIGHPYPDTLAALEGLQAKADAAGVDLVPVSALRSRAAPPS